MTLVMNIFLVLYLHGVVACVSFLNFFLSVGKICLFSQMWNLLHFWQNWKFLRYEWSACSMWRSQNGKRLNQCSQKHIFLIPWIKPHNLLQKNVDTGVWRVNGVYPPSFFPLPWIVLTTLFKSVTFWAPAIQCNITVITQVITF